MLGDRFRVWDDVLSECDTGFSFVMALRLSGKLLLRYLDCLPLLRLLTINSVTFLVRFRGIVGPDFTFQTEFAPRAIVQDLVNTVSSLPEL